MSTFSRRRFVKLGSAAALACMGPWIRTSRAQAPRLDGIPSLDGELVLDEAARRAIADDHSNLHYRVPAAVLRPRSVDDVMKIVRYANARSLKVVMKGRGHSQYGQTQAEGGIVIDSGNLNAIRFGEQFLDVQPGAFWANVATAAIPRGLTPPVFLATCMGVTVGGTLSVGGIGTNSIHRGAQVDTVTELDVVTGDGRLVTCSAEREAELFEMTLAGVGQCGVIVRARLPLEPAPSHLVIQNLVYSDMDAYLADQTTAAAQERYHTQRGVLAKGKDGKWTATMEVGRQYSSSEPDMAALRAGLHFESVAEPVRMTYKDFLYRFEELNSNNAALRATQERQFLTMWMPASTSRAYLDFVFAKDLAFNRLSAYPINTRKFTRPLFRVPDEEYAFSIWQFYVAPRGNLEARGAMMATNRELIGKMKALGGKRYAPYTGVMSPADWQEHFGPAIWQRLSQAKKRYDPSNVLTPGPNMFAAPRTAA